MTTTETPITGTTPSTTTAAPQTPVICPFCHREGEHGITPCVVDIADGDKIAAALAQIKTTVPFGA